MCQPVVLFSGQDHPWAVAVDANNLYWSTWNQGDPMNPSTVMEVPLAGGNPVTLATGQSGVGYLALDATYVYWTSYYQGTVMKVPIAGGNPITLAGAQHGPRGVAVDASNIYWTNYTTGEVMMMPLDGGNPITLASNQDHPWGVAVDANNIYWTSEGHEVYTPFTHYNAGSVVQQMPLAGGNPSLLAWSPSDTTRARDILVNGTRVYWANWNMGAPQEEWISSAPIGGGQVQHGMSFNGDAWSLALDATDFYSSGYTSVQREHLGGGGFQVLYTQNSWMLSRGIAVDATSIYFTDLLGGRVLRLAK